MWPIQSQWMWLCFIIQHLDSGYCDWQKCVSSGLWSMGSVKATCTGSAPTPLTMCWSEDGCASSTLKHMWVLLRSRSVHDSRLIISPSWTISFYTVHFSTDCWTNIEHVQTFPTIFNIISWLIEWVLLGQVYVAEWYSYLVLVKEINHDDRTSLQHGQPVWRVIT